MLVRSYDQPFMEYGSYVAHKLLLLYVPPLLLVLGTFGNVFSFFILMKSVKKASTYSYLSVLAVMDLLVLYVGLLKTWIGQFTVEYVHTNNVLCKTLTFLGYVCSDTSVWLIVAVTIERAAVVMFPLQAPRACNVRYARLTIICLVVTFAVVNCHFLWSVDLKRHTFNGTVITRCMQTPNHAELIKDVWPWVDASIYSFLPLLLITTLNSLIIKQVFKAHKARDALRQQSSLSKRNGISKKSKGQEVVSKKLTFMLLSVSFTFLITTLPMNIVLIYKSIVNVTDDDVTFSNMTLMNTIAQLFMYTNHSVNFFLYCATGRKFRTEFRAIFCCCCSTKYFKRFRRSFQRSPVSTRMYKMNSYSAPRTVFLDSDPVNDKATPI